MMGLAEDLEGANIGVRADARGSTFVCAGGFYRYSGSNNPTGPCSPPDWNNGQDCSGDPSQINGAWCGGPQTVTTCKGTERMDTVQSLLVSHGYTGPWNNSGAVLAAYNNIACPPPAPAPTLSPAPAPTLSPAPAPTGGPDIMGLLIGFGVVAGAGLLLYTQGG